MGKYLDSRGLVTLWNKIKNHFDSTLTIKKDGASLGTFACDGSQDEEIELNILQSKSYTGVIGTANNNPGAVFYFMSVLPDDWYTPCRVTYRIKAEMAGQTAGKAMSIMSIVFSRNTVSSYDVWNYIGDTTYRPYYYHYRYLATLTGFQNNYGHLMGIGLNSSYGPTSSAYSRTFTVELLEAYNCTVTLFDSMTKFANVTGTGSTNYSGETTYNGTTQGETHSGDINDVNYQNREYYGSRKTNSALYRYTICLTKSDGSLVPMNSVNNNIGTNKTLTTDSFDPFGEIFYWNTTTTYTAEANVGDGSWYRQILCDLRYSFNCGGYDTEGTLTARLPLYLVAIPQTDGSAVLSNTPLSQTLPTSEDGLIYIYLGRVYPDTYPYRVTLSLNHPIYYYKDQAVRQWTGNNPDLDAIEALSGTSGFLKKTAANTWALDSKVVLDKGGTGNNLVTSVIDGGDTNEDLVITNNGHNSCVNVNPMGVDIISNWGGATNNSNNSGTNNVNVNTGAGKLYYNSNEVAILASPTFTGTPTAPTAVSGTNTTQIATTAFVNSAITNSQENIIVDLTFDSQHSTWTDDDNNNFIYTSTQTLGELAQVASQGKNIIFKVDLYNSVGVKTNYSIAPTFGYYFARIYQYMYEPVEENSQQYDCDLYAQYSSGDWRELIDGCYSFAIHPYLTLSQNNTSWKLTLYNINNKQLAPIESLLSEATPSGWIPGDPIVESIVNYILREGSNNRYVTLQEVTDAIDDLQNEPFKTINGNSIKGTGNIYLVEDKEAPYRNQYFTIRTTTEAAVYWKATSPSVAKTISVSTDNGQTWTNYTSSTSGTQIATLESSSQKLLIKGSNTRYTNSSTSGYNYFSTSSDPIYIEGNIMSLVYGDDFANYTTLNNNTYAFCSLFTGCTSIQNAENLILPPSTASYCYYGMFAGCTNLTKVPKLPATIMDPYCYYGMFAECSSLKTAPELPAMILSNNCYSFMFAACTSLTTAPQLPATTLANQCYQNMFSSCTSLTIAPELPATSLVGSCYASMFSDCTSLTTAPQLPATTLVEGCYQRMFSGCTKLTAAPQLPATTLLAGCYYNMFYGCTSLNYVKCLATNISAEECTYQWLYQVSPTGTFVKNSSMSSWSRGESSIPSTWNICDNGYDSYAGSTTPAGPANKAVSIPFGQVDSASTSTAFTATVNGITELRDGVCVYLTNGVVTSESGYTININNLGAKPVYSSMAAATQTSTLFNVNYTLLLVYNSTRVTGGCWDCYYGYYNDTNSLGYQIRPNSGTLRLSDRIYRYRLMFTSADGSQWVPSNTSTSTNATASRTVNQRPINPFGPIMVYGSTSNFSANAVGPTTTGFQQYAFTLGYAFNRTGEALTLTTNTPVYVKCTPQSNGSAIIDADTPYTQSLPTTEDGYIYIFLGIAYSATQIELRIEHPVYYYKDGAIRLWTAEASRIAALEARIAALEQIIQGS